MALRQLVEAELCNPITVTSSPFTVINGWGSRGTPSGVQLDLEMGRSCLRRVVLNRWETVDVMLLQAHLGLWELLLAAKNLVLWCKTTHWSKAGEALPEPSTADHRRLLPILVYGFVGPAGSLRPGTSTPRAEAVYLHAVRSRAV